MKAEISPPEVTADDILSEETAHLFQQFCSRAKESGVIHLAGLHPADEEKWRDFISSSFRSGKSLPESDLVGLLMDEGWPREPAHELACDYLHSIEQLENFTREQQVPTPDAA